MGYFPVYGVIKQVKRKSCLLYSIYTTNTIYNKYNQYICMVALQSNLQAAAVFHGCSVAGGSVGAGISVGASGGASSVTVAVISSEGAARSTSTHSD